MKREDVSKIFEGATDDQISALLNINSKDIGKAKGDYDELKNKLTTANQTISDLQSSVQQLKDSNAGAEDWKQKFKDLDKQVKADAAAAKVAREKAEKEAADLADFESVAVDKDGKPLSWAHEAIKQSYFHAYTAAKADEKNKSKTGADIFHELTKDDAAAFKGVQASVQLKGNNRMSGASITKEDFKKMSYKDRVALFNDNKELYKQLNEGE